MKKRILYLLLASVSFSSFISCDINEVPETTMSDANFWNTVADIRLAANYFYSTIPGLTGQQMVTRILHQII